MYNFRRNVLVLSNASAVFITTRLLVMLFCVYDKHVQTFRTRICICTTLHYL